MKYSEISREYRALEKIGGNAEERDHRGVSNDLFWTRHKAFKVRLGVALRDGECLRKMTKTQFIQFIAWCTTFRPNEPHVILTCLARLAVN